MCDHFQMKQLVTDLQYKTRSMVGYMVF